MKRKIVKRNGKAVTGTRKHGVRGFSQFGLVGLFTRDEVARLAKVCTRTVARDVRAGRLKEKTINRRRKRYDAEAVKAYLGGDWRTP